MGCICGKSEDDKEDYDMSPIQDLPVVFVNGVPGAGNQTIAQTISDITGYVMIKPGELIRCEARTDSGRGKLIADKLNSFKEIPEQTIIDLIKEAMLSQKNVNGFIIVGFPKNARLCAMFNDQIKCPEKIVALQVANEVATSRLQSKLSDLGRPISEINAARNVVMEAANKFNKIHKRFGNHVVTLDNNGNQKALSETLKQVLSEIMVENDSDKVKPTKSSSPLKLTQRNSDTNDNIKEA